MTIETAELFADGKVNSSQLRSAAEAAMGVVGDCYDRQIPDGGCYVAYSVGSAYELDDQGYHDAAHFQPYGADAAAYVLLNLMGHTAARDYPAESAAQAELLRDLFGNPFPPAELIGQAWLAWNSGTVLRLAQAIYDQRAFDRLPVLADALEEAGCTDAAILDHCRGGGPHVRGCWVVDLLLGKQ
jgi:hypothetical protein